MIFAGTDGINADSPIVPRELKVICVRNRAAYRTDSPADRPALTGIVSLF